MTTWEIVNGTVLRRRRDPEDVEPPKPKVKRPTIAAEVKAEFRALRKMGRRTGSTR